MLLGIFPHEIGGGMFTLGLGPIFGAQKHSRKITACIFSELLPNLYYSPIKSWKIFSSLKFLVNSVHSKSSSKAIAYDFVEKERIKKKNNNKSNKS